MKPTGTIVIAADRTAECQELEAMLEGEGYRFVFVSAPDRDAKAVADKLEGIDPDVVVIGTIDSRGRGVEICQALRKQPLLGDVPIVVVVGARNTELRDRYLDSGADDFVTRPLRPTALKSRLHALVRLNRYRRQLSQATNRHAAEVMVMNRIGQVITSVLDLKQALGAIGDHAQRLLDVAATSVVLYDDETGDLWFGAASGREAEHIEGRRLTHGQGIIHWVVENGQPAIVNDVAQNPGFSSEWDQQTDFTTTSILCVPLRSKGRIIGAIEALNKASGRFDEEDLTLLASLAAWAAVAIENARLHHRTQQEIGERERIAAELHDLNRTLEEAIDERTRELQAERDRTQAILEAVGEAVIVTDLEGRIQYLNPAAAELTGYRLDELAGHQVWQHDVAPSHPARQTHTEPLLSTRRMELVSRRKDGTLYDVATTVAPLFDSQLPNRVMGYVYVQRDITPVKDAERMKDEFISNLSHELRTPLSVIALVTGNLDRLYDRLSDQRRRKLIGDMREHAQVLDDLIGDVLEISRIDSGRISSERQQVDLAQLVREESKKQQPLAERKSQTLEVTGVNALPVEGNREQLRMVIRNLLNNAIKYTPPGGHIQCCCRIVTPCTGSTRGADLAEDEAWPGCDALETGGWAALCVKDTGVGISPRDLPRIYERFYRVNGESHVPGTGLGLSITKELTEAHGGRIAAASVPGVGSSFAVYLPLVEE